MFGFVFSFRMLKKGKETLITFPKSKKKERKKEKKEKKEQTCLSLLTSKSQAFGLSVRSGR